ALPHLRQLRRPLPAGIGSLGARHRGNRGIMSAARAKDEMRPRLDRVLRVLLPIAVLALGVVLWELVVRVGDIPPYVLPGPRLVFSTLSPTGRCCRLHFSLRSRPRSKVFCSRPPAASGWPCCSTSRASSNIRSIPTR